MMNWRWVLLSCALSLPAPAPLSAQARRVVPAPVDTTSGRAETTEAEAPTALDSPRKQPETILDFAVAGGWMMVPLTVLSVFWLSFFIERLIALREKKVLPRPLVTAVQGWIASRPLDRDKARTVLDANPSSAAAVLRVALARLDLRPEEIAEGVNSAAQREIFRLKRNLWIFAIVSTVAPLMGLLGTVAGLVTAFREVAVSGLGSGANLAPGIYEALVTTIAGLAIAIPSVAAYYWFHARIDYFVNEIDSLVTDLVDAHRLSPALAGSTRAP